MVVNMKISYASMLTTMILYAMVKLHTSGLCCIKPRGVADEWREALEKKFTRNAAYVSATNLSFIPLYAFAEFRNVTVSSID